MIVCDKCYSNKEPKIDSDGMGTTWQSGGVREMRIEWDKSTQWSGHLCPTCKEKCRKAFIAEISNKD